jgi:hypothetical protein
MSDTPRMIDGFPWEGLKFTPADAKLVHSATFDVRDFPPPMRLSDVDVRLLDHVTFYPSDNKGDVH